ncbi:DUF3151 domain-containing protein [Humibacter sp. BT305]|uniref:DUF3151 domain-containing protein n=1 Tax=Cnuibacter physcomitrellae TaxID=1619308 RepID=UPI000E0A3E6D|nr:DUF3151 domain-containing protein [Cnuibacter physcomitrellae]AXH35869.1 DUF3151 domain-containing protein [Humibacter sp. BT305]MCS5496809.1 DUF3151 domain-containing protein [Cnuibacter physcomitrellae]
MTSENLLGLPPTLLPAEPGVADALARAVGYEVDEALADAVTRFPTSSLAWATLSDRAWSRREKVPAYAYARVGYHRGLDALRKAGWRGQGPVPWSHEPNRGVLLSLYMLRRAAEGIGETAEVDRLTEFLNGADPQAIARIEAGER